MAILFTQIITVCKQSLRRLCFYTCLPFCSQWGCLGPGPGGLPMGGSAQRGVSRPRGAGQGLGEAQARRGGVSRPRPRGVCIPASLRQTPPPVDSYCCGLYASYWNAFLFIYVFNSLLQQNAFKLNEVNGNCSQTSEIIITACKQSLGQGNIFTPVCHSVHRGGVPDQVHPPGTRYTPPWTRYTPWDQVHPLGPGTPPGTRYTPMGPGTPPWVNSNFFNSNFF